MFKDLTEAEKWVWCVKTTVLVGFGGVLVYALVKR